MVLIQQATSGSFNATTTADNPYPAIPTCCYLDSFALSQVLWYTGSVEVTVATVSTIVYQYNNTATTSYKTITANNTQSLPTTLFDNFGTFTLSGVPTDIIGPDLGPYEALTTLITGTEFTDPYGVVYTSPTPVWVYEDVSYYTSAPIPSGTGYACPSVQYGGIGDGIEIYPSGMLDVHTLFTLCGLPRLTSNLIRHSHLHRMYSYPYLGFYMIDNDPKYGQGNSGELYTILPEQLKDWVVSHVPPNVDSEWSSVSQCTLGFGDGIPVAHVPVTELTAGVTTTTTMTGDLGGVTTTPTLISTSPQLDTQLTSTPAGESSSSLIVEIPLLRLQTLHRLRPQ